MRSRCARVVATLFVFASCAHASIQPADGVAADAGPSDPVAALASAADSPARQQVASAFLRALAENPNAQVPRAWLAEQPAESFRLLLETVESQDQIEGLAAALRRSLRVPDVDDAEKLQVGGLSADARLAALDLLARSLEPASCELLVGWLAITSERERPAISQALVRITGRDDLGQSVEGWQAWLNSHRHLPPLAWRSLLVEGLRDRAARLDRRQRDLLSRLDESARRVHGSLLPDQRPAYLVVLLTDSEPRLRSVGTELVLRELERGFSPSVDVSAAVVKLLDDTEPALRQSAALLVDRIVPEGSSARLSVALRRETEPDVAAAMLRAFQRSPDSAAIDAVLRWRESGTSAAEDALRAVVSLLDAGFEPTPSQRERILATIDVQDLSNLSVASIPVINRLAGDAERAVVLELLQAQRAELRRAAASLLESRAWALPALLDAAERDAALLQRAADAVARHGPSSDRLVRVAMIESRVPFATGVPAMPVTSALARFTFIGDRLAAAQEVSDRVVLVRAILGDVERESFIAGPLGDAAHARAQRLLGLPASSDDEDVLVAEAQPDATRSDSPESAQGDSTQNEVEETPSDPADGGAPQVDPDRSTDPDPQPER